MTEPAPRQILFLGYTPARIRSALEGKSDRQCKDMLFADMRIVNRKADESSPSPSPTLDIPAPVHPRTESWTRIVLSESAELHLKSPPRRMTTKERKELLELVESGLENGKGGREE
jgi:hypothetical protein